MNTITKPAQFRQAIQTGLGLTNIKAAETLSCPSDYFLCPESLLRPGGCCRNGYACGDGYCVETFRTSTGMTTVISVTTVSATYVADPGNTNKEYLTAADIGGVVGGVIGGLLILVIVVWVILRRLNGVMKYVQARLGPPPGNIIPGTERHSVGSNDSRSLSQQLPSEVWDPQSEGMFRRPLGELSGSYDAHGTSELEGKVSPTEEAYEKQF